MAFAAIAALSSCSQDEEFLLGDNQLSNDGNAVTFGTYLGQAPESRASVITTDNLKTKGFGVFAYYTGQNDYVAGASVPNFMCNQEVIHDGSAWTYSPMKYWPGTDGDKLSFFAYAPYTETPGSVNITKLPQNTDQTDPTLSFKVASDVKEQIDLLYSAAHTNVEKQAVNDKVTFQFNHALSRLGFKAKLLIDDIFNDTSTGNSTDGVKVGADTKVTINEIKISSDEFYATADLNLNGGKWTNWKKSENGAMEFVLDADDLEDAAITSETPIVKLNKDDSYLMLIPSIAERLSDGSDVTTPIIVNLVVKYTVETADPKLPDGKSIIHCEVPTTFKHTFKQGMATNLVLNIGLTSVKCEPTVTPWTETDEDISASNNYKGYIKMHTTNGVDEMKAYILNNENGSSYDPNNMIERQNYEVKITTMGFLCPEFDFCCLDAEESDLTCLAWSTKKLPVVVINGEENDYENVADYLKDLKERNIPVWKPKEEFKLPEGTDHIDLYPVVYKNNE